MITINDNDMPISVAEKLITGKRPACFSETAKAVAKALTGDDKAGETIDMFSIEEIKEIADYLLAYYEAHKENDYYGD